MRALRWMRMLNHVGVAFLLLRMVYPRTSRATHRNLHGWWSRRLLQVLGIEIRIDGLPERAEGTTLIAANHVSWIDIFAIAGVRPTRFIAKSEIRDWPVAGWISQKAGTIFIHRSRRHDTARINSVVHSALAEGDCVGLFPEGATTEGDVLLKFHSSLFEPAVANGARVQPIAIRYEHPDGSLCRAMGFVGELTFVQSVGLVIRQRGVVARLQFAQPIEAAGLTRRDLARMAQDRVAELLGVTCPDKAPQTPPGR